MPLDAFFLAALRGELHTLLQGMKIDKIQQPEQDQIVLTLRGFSGAEQLRKAPRLLLSVGANDARCHLTEAVFENPPAPPMFCMLLRKHLIGARIKSINQLPLERALDMTLDCFDALGEPCEKHIILELMGRYSNIILTDQNYLIVECLRRVDTIMSEKRQVLPGLYYREPPKQEKHDPLAVTQELFIELAGQIPEGRTVERWLVDTFGGLSPLLGREIVFKAFCETDKRFDALTKIDDVVRLSNSFFALIDDIKGNQFCPTMLLDNEGKPYDFSYTAISQYGTALQQEGALSFSVLLDTFYTRKFAAERMRQRSQALTKAIKNARDRILRKLENQRAELSLTEGRERQRELGDILTAQLHLLKKGMTSFRTLDYYSENAHEVDIRLDPLKTPQQNAAKYYKDYSKAKTAEVILKEQIALGEREQLYLGSVLDELARAESERDLTEVRQELVTTGYLKDQKSGKKQKPIEGVPMRFTASDGSVIYAGRNNIQNELLTHRLARKTDIWLHAQKIPGSHVIISIDGQAPSEMTLKEAASIAAYYSQARDSGKVQVDYAAVKLIKKMPGGRPGQVTYSDYKTLVAVPDEVLVKKLKMT